jgi:hypothetical protein
MSNVLAAAGFPISACSTLVPPCNVLAGAGFPISAYWTLVPPCAPGVNPDLGFLQQSSEQWLSSPSGRGRDPGPGGVVVVAIPVRVWIAECDAGQHEAERGSAAVLQFACEIVNERALDAEGSNDDDRVDRRAERHGVANHRDRRCVDKYNVELVAERIEKGRDPLPCKKLPCRWRNRSARQELEGRFDLPWTIGHAGGRRRLAISLAKRLQPAGRWQRQVAYCTIKGFATHDDIRKTGLGLDTEKGVEKWSP